MSRKVVDGTTRDDTCTTCDGRRVGDLFCTECARAFDRAKLRGLTSYLRWMADRARKFEREKNARGSLVFRNMLRELVDLHRARLGARLLLAFRLQDPRRPQDVIILEAYAGFGADIPSHDRKFLELHTVEPKLALGFSGDAELRIILTSAAELEEAARRSWPHLRRLRKFTRLETIHVDRRCRDLLETFSGGVR